MSRVVTLAAASSAATVPVMWDVLGYHFPAGSMLVGLLAASMARVFVTRTEKGPRDWTLDVIIMGVVLLTTAVWIATRHCDLWEALGTGLLIGMAGALILIVAKSRAQAGIDAMFGKLGGAPAPPPPPPEPTPVGQALREAFPVKPEEGSGP